MKKAFLIIAMVGLGLGCSEDPEASQRNQAAQTFEDQALEHMRNISAGYVADIDDLRLNKGVDVYQAEQREQAMTVLRELVNQGSESQQVSAAIALGDLHAQRARESTREALLEWSKLSAGGTELQALLARARREQTLSSTLATTSNSQILTQTRSRLQEATDQKDQLDSTIADLDQQIQQLTSQMQEFEAERDQQLAQAEKLRGQSYDAQRQTRYDLQVQAAEHTRQADEAGLQAELLSQQINLLQGRRAVAAAKLAEVQARVDQLNDLIDQLNQRDVQRNQLATQRSSAAETAATELVDQLNQMTQTLKTDVVDAYDSARADYNQAIQLMEQARDKAPSELRSVVRLELGSHQSELGQALRHLTIIRDSYANILDLMADQAEQGFPPQQQTTILEMASVAQEKAAQVRQEAIETLQTATETLSGAIDALPGGSAYEPIEAAAQGQLAAANRSLNALTGNAPAASGPRNPRTVATPEPIPAGSFRGSPADNQAGNPMTAGGDTTPDPAARAALEAGNATAEQTVIAVTDGLAAGEPIVLWTAMPESYRSDLTEVIHSFGGAVDAELYNQMFAIIGKAADVMQSKKTFFMNHPMIAENPQADPATVDQHWDNVVWSLRAVADSPFATAEGLQQVDIAAFLSGQGQAIMNRLLEATQAAPGPSPAMLAGVTATVVSSDAQTTTLQVSNPMGPPEQVQLVKVENRWVPREMADTWDQQMTAARQQIAMIQAEGVPNKPQVMGMLNMVEGVLDQLAAAESQQQFNQTIDQIQQSVGMMMMGLGGGMGPGGPMGPGDGMDMEMDMDMEMQWEEMDEGDMDVEWQEMEIPADETMTE